MARRLTLGFKASKAQNEVYCGTKRFKVIKAGRRGGKTKFACFWLTRLGLMFKADNGKPGVYWYVAKSLGLIREEVWAELIANIRKAEEELGVKLLLRADERLLEIHFLSLSGHKAIIYCKSTEKEDNLRGRGVRAMVLDEAAFTRATTWSRVLRATLVDYSGPALIMSSAKKSWFTRMWKDAKEKRLPDAEAFKFTIYDNPIISPEEIESLRLSTPEDIWLEEYMAEEQEHRGVVLDEFDSNSVFNPDQKFLDVRRWPCVRGMDWGGEAETAAAFVHIHPNGYLVVSDEYSEDGFDVAKHSTAIRRKSEGLSIASNNTVLDQSAFRREGTSNGATIAKRFQENGIRCQRAERDLDAGVDILKRGFRGDGATPWIYISTRCPKLIAAVQDWEYGSHEPDVLAAFRYAAAHAVGRRMTAIFGTLPEFQGSRFQNLDADPERLAQAGKVILPGFHNRNKRTSWGWDHAMGAPC